MADCAAGGPPVGMTAGPLLMLDPLFPGETAPVSLGEAVGSEGESDGEGVTGGVLGESGGVGVTEPVPVVGDGVALDGEADGVGFGDGADGDGVGAWHARAGARGEA